MIRYLLTGITLLVALVCSVDARVTHDTRSVGEEQAAWWADSAQAYVVQGCAHPLSINTTVSIVSCAVFIKDLTPPRQMRYAEEFSRTFSYNAGDGIYWLAMHASETEEVDGWSSIINTHYRFKVSAEVPVIPNRMLLVGRVVVDGGAVTAVDFSLAPIHPFIFDGAVYFEQFGMVCDGVTDNSDAMAAAKAALPLTGGHLIFPASRFPCLFSESFRVTDRPVVISGAGGTGAAKTQTPAETTVTYTGSDSFAFDIDGGSSRGSVIENFEINHTGTAAAAIRFGIGNSNVIRGVTINVPTVQFSRAGFVVTDVEITGHSHSIVNNILTSSAPIGLEITRAINVQVFNNTIQEHSACNIAVGSAFVAKDTHVILNRLESRLVNSRALCLKSVEGGWFLDNHFELGNGSLSLASTLSTDSKCEMCVFKNNQINLLGTAVPTQAIFTFDAPGSNPAAYVYLENNRIEDNRLDTGVPINVVELGNTSGRGGASIISITDNEISATIGLVSHPERIRVMYDHNNNWSLGNLRDGKNRNLCINAVGVGNIDAGEDLLMPACSVLPNRLRAIGVGLNITQAGNSANNTNDKRYRLYFGAVDPANLLFDTGITALTSVAWRIECNLVRSSTIAVRSFCTGNDFSTEAAVRTNMKTTYATVELADPFFDQAIPVQLTCEGEATNDCMHFYQYIELVQN